MALITVVKGRGLTKILTILDPDSVAIVPQANDLIRVIIGRVGWLGVANVDAQLVVTSGTDTANGSSFTKNSPTSGQNTLRLDASDLEFTPGPYSMLLDYFDNADEGEWKNVDTHTFVLREI